jgi:type IX secretion system PorP/SprF family membrane protein
MKNLYLVFFTFLIMHSFVSSQDLHYTQFYASPLNLNPAAAGVFYGDYRFAANYRDQWSSLGTPYTTMSLSYDMKLFKRQLDGNFIGVGLIINEDKAGDAKLQNFQTNVALSFNKALNGDGNHYISVGGQYGYAQRSVSVSNATWDSQWDGNEYNANFPVNEPLNQSFWYSDLSAGLMWHYAPSQLMNFNLGFGMEHINQPNISFITNAQDILYKRYNIHTTDFFAMSEAENLYLVPSILYTWQGPAKELDFGSFLMYIMTDRSRYTKFKGEIDLSFGLFVRAKDAIMPAIRIGIRNLAFGVSYDINTSKLNEATGGSGGLEFSLIYSNRITKSHFRRGAPKDTRYL